jgi:hypothetical protein
MFKLQKPGSLKIAVFLIIGTILTTTASFVFKNPWLMPILGAAVPYPIYLIYIKQEKYRSAFGWVLFWAVCQSLAIGLATVIAPDDAAQAILSGKLYTTEMFHWVKTGEGTEGNIHLFLPIHLRQYVLFSLLSLLSLGSLSLILGTYLLNYMNFYVAQIVSLSHHPWLTLCLAWYPWSILRVIGFIATGEALTALGLSFIQQKRGKPPLLFPRSFLIMGATFVVADIIVKALLAPIWRQFLLKSLGS